MKLFSRLLVCCILMLMNDFANGRAVFDEGSMIRTMRDLGGRIQFMVTFRNEFLDNHSETTALDSKALYPFFKDMVLPIAKKLQFVISGGQCLLSEYMSRNNIVINNAEGLEKHPHVRYLTQGWYVYCYAKDASDNTKNKHMRVLESNAVRWEWRSIKKYIVCNSWAMEGNMDVIKYFIDCPDVLEISTNLPCGEIQGDSGMVEGQSRYDGYGWGDEYSRSRSNMFYQNEHRQHFHRQANIYHQPFGHTDTIRRGSNSACDDSTLFGKYNHIEPNIRMVKADKVWHITKGHGAILGVADTGVDMNSPVVSKNYVGSGKKTNDYCWWDSVRECYLGQHRHKLNDDRFYSTHCNSNENLALSSPQDSRGHGTFVCAIAVGDNGLGVAPEATWIASRNMLDGDGSLFSYIDTLNFFLAPTKLSGEHPDPGRRPHVVVNSYTCSPSEGDSIIGFSQVMRTMYLSGIFMAVAAGNRGKDGMGTLNRYPSIDPLVTTVGATYVNDHMLHDGSSKGPIPTALRDQMLSIGQRSKLNTKPDLVAPGRDVCSWDSKYPHLVRYTGTSMATPHVAGAALLLCSAFPYLLGNPDMIRRILVNSSMPLSDRSGRCEGHPNHCSGYGLLQIDMAFNMAGKMKHS